MLDFLAQVGAIVRADVGFYWDCPVWPDVVADRITCGWQGITGDDGGDPEDFIAAQGRGVVPWRVVDSDDPWPIAG